MLFIIISIFIYFIISFGFGSLINKYFQVNNLLSLKLLIGILFIGIISLISSIVIPLNINYEIVISLAGIILAIYYKFWKVEFKFNYSFIIPAVITCLIASMDSFIYDTYSYYLPTIRFLDDFGLLKGLGNFDFNLGQTSLWHIIQASTNNTIDLSYKLNAYLIIIYLIYIYENNLKKYIIFLPLFYLFVASPSPDLPIFVLSIITILNWIIYKNEDSIRYGLLLSAFLVLIKPIAFVLPIFFLIISLKNYNNYLKLYFIVGCLAILFFIKNIILTGNFTFPIGFGNISELPFSVPVELYRISTLEGRYILLDTENKIEFSEFLNWSSVQYYIYLFQIFKFPFLFTVF
ncbi:LIC_10190 family membrane protein [Faecalibacter bovis]